MLTRRKSLIGLTAGIICAPAIVRAQSAIIGSGIIGDLKVSAGGTVLIAHTKVQYSSASSGATTPAIDTTGANIIVAYAGGDQGAVSLPVVSDSKSNTWTKNTEVDNGAGSKGALSYTNTTANPTVGAGHTFTISVVTNSFAVLIVAAFKNAVTAPFDVENGAFGTGGTIQPGSVSPSTDNQLVVCGIGTGGSSDPTALSGFTLADHIVAAPGTAYGGGIAFLKQGAKTPVNPTWTVSDPTQSWTTCISTYKGT